MTAIHNQSYVAFLRGINVGGHNKVKMKELKATFEKIGFSSVRSYIASGNILFATQKLNTEKLVKTIETAIKNDFGINIPILILTQDQIKKIVKQIPTNWSNDKEMRCDVFLLWDTIDTKKTLEQLPSNVAIEDVFYIPGAIIWRIDRVNVTKSRMAKIIGTKLYQQITIRNINTIRKVNTMMTHDKKTSNDSIEEK